MERFLKLYKELCQDLNDDCNSFDQGKEYKAKDIAGRIRTLVKDGPNPNTISLLTHIGKKDILFVDSCIPYTNPVGFSHFDILTPLSNTIINVSNIFIGLLYKKVLEGENGLEFYFEPLSRRISIVPKLKEVPFDDWWNQTIYEDNDRNIKLSRRSLTLSMAEKDGFAHVDKSLNVEYEEFLRSDTLSLYFNGQKVLFANNPAKNSMRQIGYELLLTLNKNINI